MKTRDLANLLSRTQAYIEDNNSITVQEKDELLEDIAAAVNELAPQETEEDTPGPSL